MSYQRKTKDEYQVITNYGYGWEVEVTEETFKEAKLRKKEYLENASGLKGIKIKRVRTIATGSSRGLGLK